MIPEEQQEQAVLYVLGSLDADEASRFERQMEASPALRAFVQECLESSSLLALTAYPMAGHPPPDVKARVMKQLAATRDLPRRKTTRFPFKGSRLPWAIAAVLLLFCGWLGWRQVHLRHENKSLTASLQKNGAPATSVGDPLRDIVLCELAAPDGGPVPAGRATVAWDPARREGVLQIAHLPPPAESQDYQLWAVEDGRPAPVNAGLVHLDAQGQATTVFRPDREADGGRVLAFALSLEKAGGSPVNAGPIILSGKL